MKTKTLAVLCSLLLCLALLVSCKVEFPENRENSTDSVSDSSIDLSDTSDEGSSQDEISSAPSPGSPNASSSGGNSSTGGSSSNGGANTAPSASSSSTPSSPVPQAKTIAFSIDCESARDHWDKFSPEKQAIIPENYYFISPVSVEFSEGESAFDVLQRITRGRGIHFDFIYDAVYKSYYVRGIGNLYEKDCGGKGGWVYLINGKFANVGMNKYKLKAGDKIEITYSCDEGDVFQ